MVTVRKPSRSSTAVIVPVKVVQDHKDSIITIKVAIIGRKVLITATIITIAAAITRIVRRVITDAIITITTAAGIIIKDRSRADITAAGITTEDHRADSIKADLIIEDRREVKLQNSYWSARNS